MAGQGGGKSRKLLTAGGVLALHLLLLGPLALRQVDRQESTEPSVFDVRLERPARRASASVAVRPTPAGAVNPPAAPRHEPDEAPPSSPASADIAGEEPVSAAAIARSMRLNSDCGRLIDPAERALCLERRGERLAQAGRSIRPVEDAAFAAEGQRALADYDRRRAPLKPNSRATSCPNADLMGRCHFRVETRIWSSRDGLLPDVPRRD